MVLGGCGVHIFKDSCRVSCLDVLAQEVVRPDGPEGVQFKAPCLTLVLKSSICETR